MFEDEDEYDFWKIDKSMGESRLDQILGAVILVGMFVSSLFYFLQR
jgi:hypothetical protein